MAGYKVGVRSSTLGRPPHPVSPRLKPAFSSSLGAKDPEREANHSPPSSIKFEVVWPSSGPPTPYVFMGDQSCKLLLAFASIVILGSGPRGTHNHIFFLSHDSV